MRFPKCDTQGSGFWILGIVFCLGLVHPVRAQPQEPAPPAAEAARAAEEPTPEQRIERIRSERQTLGEETAALKKALAEQSAESDRVERLRQRLELLTQLDTAYDQQITAMQQALGLVDEERQYRETLSKAAEASGEGDPVALSELDRAREELEVQVGRRSAVEARVEQARTVLKQARKAANDRQDQLERLRSAAETTPDDPGAEERLQRAELEQRLARELVALREIELANEERAGSIYRMHLERLRSKAERMGERVVFSADELGRQLQQIDSDEFGFRRELNKAVDQQLATRNRLAEARERLARASADEQETVLEEVEARKLADEVLKSRIEHLGKRIDLLADAREAWRRRHAVFNGLGGQAEWVKWKQEALAKAEAIAAEERLLRLWLNDWQNRSTLIETKLSGLGPDAAPAPRWLEQQRRQIQDLIDGLREHKGFLENTRRLHQKLADTVTERTAHRSWREWRDLILDLELAGNRVSDWGLAAAGASGLFLLLLFVRNFVISRWQHYVEERKTPVLAEFVASMRHTTLFFLLMMSVFISVLRLRLDPEVAQFIRNLTMMALIIQAAIWLSYFFRSWIFEYLARKTKRDQASMGALSIFNFLSQLLVWSLATLLVLQNIGINVTALVTGLGIGGIAVALALQRVLGDVLSSLSIVFDKPFVAGDFIVFDQYMGTVEHIGVKTTLIRSLGGEQIICPNSDLLNAHIRNYKRMRERRVVFQIGVIYQTPYHKLVRIPGMLRAIVEAHKQTRFDRAHFSAYGDFALRFEIVYYVLSADYGVYMDIQQGINLAIFEQFRREGIEFAYPTQMLYLEGTGKAAEGRPQTFPVEAGALAQRRPLR